MMRAPILVDVETVPHPCAHDFVPPPDLTAITAARNIKDPVKIAADVETRKAAALADHAAQLAKASLDWNLARIVAIGWSVDDGDTVTAHPLRDEQDEADALRVFWLAQQERPVLGFCTRTFDAPMLMQRSRLLQVPYPALDLARYGRSRDVIDLRDVLTFDDARYEAIMPRSLRMFCRRFGIAVDDPVDGADIAALVEREDWDAVIGHVTSDVRLVAALARRLGVLAVEAPV